MQLEVMREYFGEYQSVGRFSDTGSSAPAFAYSEEYLLKAEAQPLSLSLPLRYQSFDNVQYQGFFEGLVPEGRVRTELAYRLQVSQSDYLALLQHLSFENIGALLFIDETNEGAESLEPHYQPLPQATLTDLMERPVQTSALLATEGRFSLAGAQSKIGVYIQANELATNVQSNDWFLPVGTAPSSHIIKIPDSEHAELPLNEVFCMMTAKECGVNAAEVALGSFRGRNYFIAKRFDRLLDESVIMIDDMPRPQRLHQEDLCQALGWPSYRKYEIEENDNYVAIIGRLLERGSSDAIRDKVSFARQIIFDYLIGNCDNHIKNFSLLSSRDWRERRLAPAYDIVSTTVMNYSHAMGMAIGNSRAIDSITQEDWLLFTQDLRMPRDLFMDTLTGVASAFESACIAAKEQLVEFDEHATLEKIIANAFPRYNLLLSVDF